MTIIAETIEQGKATRPAEGSETSFLRLLKLAEALPAPARGVFGRLLRRDPPLPLTGERKGYCFAKVARLAEELSVSERTVQRGLKQLRELGIIERDRENPLKIYIHYGMLRFLSPPRNAFCPGCGRRLPARRRPNKRHCGPSCRVRAHRRRRRRAVTPPKRFLSPPTKTPTTLKRKNKDDDYRPEGVTLSVTPRHPKLQRLCRRPEQLGRLVRIYGLERVVKAIQVADVEYPPDNGNGIHNAYALIFALCRDLDDTPLRELEERRRHRQKLKEQERLLRELQERGCKNCGFWDVDLSGYCYECRMERERQQRSERLEPGPQAIIGS